MVIESREVAHPSYADAIVRTPAVLAVDVADAEVYEQECFGPVAYLITTGSTDESIDAVPARPCVEHGAMTAAVYSHQRRGARRRCGRPRSTPASR